MRIPSFTAEASLYKIKEASWFSEAVPTGGPPILPQLGFGGAGIGVTYPPGGDDCYCCVQWTRCPCGLSLG
jgi:hypothetical protein